MTHLRPVGRRVVRDQCHAARAAFHGPRYKHPAKPLLEASGVHPRVGLVKVRQGWVRPAPRKHGGVLDFPMMEIGSFSAPVALVQQTNVPRSLASMDFIPRAGRRAPADT